MRYLLTALFLCSPLTLCGYVLAAAGAGAGYAMGEDNGTKAVPADRDGKSTEEDPAAP